MRYWIWGLAAAAAGAWLAGAGRAPRYSEAVGWMPRGRRQETVAEPGSMEGAIFDEALAWEHLDPVRAEAFEAAIWGCGQPTAAGRASAPATAG